MRFKHIAIIASVLLVMILGFEMDKEPQPYPFPDLGYFPKMPTATENSVTVQGAELGRFLFYDPILSEDFTISCSTCHQQSAAFSDAPKSFSQGVQRTELSRNTMPLFNLAWYPSMFWDGKAISIEEQVFHPVSTHNEMNLDWAIAVQRIQQNDFYKTKFLAAFGNEVIDSVLIARAIAQFERTLISYNSKYDKAIRGEFFLSPDEYKGFELMNDQTKGDCLHCHTTDADVLGTSGKFSNNGLDAAISPADYKDKGKGGISGKEEDFGWFKIPSLRNIAVTPPYMHDGRFKTLEEVLDFYSEGVKESYNVDSKMSFAHQGGAQLNKEEKEKIITFLHTMTDSVFLTDPKFSNPW